MSKANTTIVVLSAAILTFTACGSTGGSDDAAEAVAEQVVDEILEEAADGEIAVNTDDGDITLTDEDGSVVMETDDDEMTMTVENDEGGFEATLGGELPDGFPFPLPSEFEVRSSMEIDDADGTSFSAVIVVAAEEYDSVKAMYQTWLEGEGFEVDAFEVDNADGTSGVFLNGIRSDVDAFISISVEEVANDDAGNLTYETAISLTWTPNG